MNKVETIIIVYVCMRVIFAYSLKEDHCIQWKKYKFHSNTRAIGYDNSRSVTHCTMKCFATPACVAAKFNTTNGDCEFHQVYNVDTPIMIVAENSSVVVVKSELYVESLNDCWMKHAGDDCFTQSTDYAGKGNCTVSGITCQHWNTHSPHSLTYTPTDPTDKASNFCRDPSSNGHPWCYTTDENVRWEYCPVPRCPE